jgi:hypothetical protein
LNIHPLLLISENDKEKDNYTKRFFNQIQFLSNKFDIYFNNIFNHYRNKKDKLIFGLWYNKFNNKCINLLSLCY